MSDAIATRPSFSTRRGWVVQAVLSSIFSGGFKGGDRLVEEELALTLGVSRTPIREAFSDLAAVWLITLKPNHGAVVCPFGPTQIRELYHLRRVLESEATRLAVERIDLAALSQLRREHEELLNSPGPHGAVWSAAVLALDEKFHQLIARNSGSERLAEEIGRYRELIISVRQAVGNIARAQDVALVEHIAIIDHLLAREGDLAASAMTRHIIRGTEAAVTALFSTARQRATAASALKNGPVKVSAKLPAKVDRR